MNRKALLAAVVAGLIGLGMLVVYLQRYKEEASGGAPIRVVIARQDIALGARLTKGMIGLRDLPETYVEDRHIRATDAQRILGVRVSMGVKAGESIMWTDLATTSEERRDLSGLVQTGKRAITIRADATSSFGGLLRPGDRVDVLLTTTASETSPESRTLPLLQNLLVLACGQDMGGARAAVTETGRRSGDLNQVTVAVTIQQAQLLTYAQERGSLSLALRNPDDIAVLEGLPDTTAADILESERRSTTQHAGRPVQTRQIEHVQ